MTNPKDKPLERQGTQSGGNISPPDDVRHFILEQLAEIRLVDASILKQEIAHNGGDLEIKSDEGTSITGGLEGVIGRELAGPEDIDPRHYTSVERLTHLLHESLQKPPKRRSPRKPKRN